MIDATPLLRLYVRFRTRQLARLDSRAVQQQTLLRLLAQAAATRFGRDHGFARIRDYHDFRQAVPLRRYDDFWTSYWQPAFPNLVDCTWPGRVPYFAATSGTTTGATKFIPLTPAMLRANRQAGLDLLVFHARMRPRSRVLAGRNLLLGGSTDLAERASGVKSGDLSGIAAATLPSWARLFAFPPPEIARLTDWPAKMARLAERAPSANIRSIAGTPSWLLLFFDELLHQRPGESARLADFFPDLELIVHGGVNFAPYRRRFADWLDDGHAELREVYAASEGFIATADQGDGEGLRVNLDHGIFYEFVPVAEIDADVPTRHWIGDIELGVDYALVLTTCVGLWAYIIGDTIRFISRDPPRLLVSGRLSYTLSAFGEHLIGEEIEAAVSAAAAEIGVGVRDFSVGAVYPEQRGGIAGHLYIIEFERPIDTAAHERFANAIDRDLMQRNLDYQDHRAGGFGLLAPQLALMRQGGFAEWMRRRGRLGSQNKVPRVIADPELFADLKNFAAANPAD